jgi:hypothetical protein
MRPSGKNSTTVGDSTLGTIKESTSPGTWLKAEEAITKTLQSIDPNLWILAIELSSCDLQTSQNHCIAETFLPGQPYRSLR